MPFLCTDQRQLSSYELLAWNFYWIKVRTLNWPFQNIHFFLFSFNHFLVEPFVCLGLLSCCKLIASSMMAMRTGPDASKQTQIIILPLPCFIDRIRTLGWSFLSGNVYFENLWKSLLSLCVNMWRHSSTGKFSGQMSLYILLSLYQAWCLV